MKTIIFATAIRILTPLFLLFSIYILFRGHNHPGGGFIGGLIGSITFVFHVLAHGSQRTAKEYFSLKLYRYEKLPAQGQFNYFKRFINHKFFNREIKGEPWGYYLIRLRPSFVMGTGLVMAAGSGMVGLFKGDPFMTGYWLDAKVPVIGSVGTPLLFDMGVYQLVLGMVLKIIFTMSRD
ncbi:MnhB domain-containing protein [Pontibacter locisalis]|uniref:MnhB domain-containing protein n=1 Tax=Pontibacter locisalis TaxID=1719035 RepID=A0ABW5IRR2_9BACT